MFASLMLLEPANYYTALESFVIPVKHLVK